MSQRIPLNQNRRVTGTTEILELCKDMLRLEHGIGNDFDMDTAEFTEFRAQFLADFAQIPLIIGIDGRSGTGKTSLAAQLEQELTAAGHSVHVLHLDDFYPGWDGLFDGVEAWDALSARDRGILGQLATDGPTRTADLSDSLGVSLRTTQRTMKKLAVIGLVSLQGKANESRYYLNVDSRKGE